MDGTDQVGLRMPKDLIAKIDTEAARQGRTRSNLIVHLLRLVLETRQQREATRAE